jgi:hypothetical protein
MPQPIQGTPRQTPVTAASDFALAVGMEGGVGTGLAAAKRKENNAKKAAALADLALPPALQQRLAALRCCGVHVYFVLWGPERASLRTVIDLPDDATHGRTLESEQRPLVGEVGWTEPNALLAEAQRAGRHRVPDSRERSRAGAGERRLHEPIIAPHELRPSPALRHPRRGSRCTLLVTRALMNDDDPLPPDFDPAYYLLINPDVAAAGQDAADHYLRFGRHENRSYTRTKPPAVTAPAEAPSAPRVQAELGAELGANAAAAPPHAQLQPEELFKTIAVVGSAPSAPEIDALLGEHTIVVTLNNAWRATNRRDYLVYADDLPDASKPELRERALRGRSSPQYLPAVNAFGGLLHCGASLAFAAGYWLLRAMPCSQISYFAADMVYTTQQSHFYGRGQPDPLRPDPSLQDHGAKCLRLVYFGLKNGCLFLNASATVETRLAFPRVRSGASLAKNVMHLLQGLLHTELTAMNDLAAEAIALERTAAFDMQASAYGRLLTDHDVWRHAAAVDSRWRALEPNVARIERSVNAALAAG